LRMIGFDPFETEVGDIDITIIHASFFSKATMWLKTRVASNGREWVLIQSTEYHFYFTSPSHFNST
jgi:hypothetical protein